MSVGSIIFRMWVIVTALVYLITLVGLVEFLFTAVVNPRMGMGIPLGVCLLIGGIASESSDTFRWR